MVENIATDFYSEYHGARTWAAAMATYDIRGRRDLGTIDKIQMTLDPWSPLVVTRAPRAIPALHVEAPIEAPRVTH